MASSSIKTIIIDDNKEFLFALRENLSLIPYIEIVGEATHYQKAKQLLLNRQADLIFLDIEMPCRNGFELLDEVRDSVKKPFKVIFYTAYDKYMIDALRKSAFDFLVKPAQMEEVKGVIDRYRKLDQEKPIALTPFQSSPIAGMVALPVAVGLKFVDRNQIILLQCTKDGLLERPIWEALLNSGERIKLRQNLSANQLADLTGNQLFIKLNKSTLVNKNFIGLIEYKTRICKLIPPYDAIDLTISRQQLSELRDQLDLV